MAEHSFQEVMRQWVRARKATKCCGEENNMLSVYPLEAYDDTLIANIEEHVMQWAARNPEPTYPTWAEFLKDNNIIGVEYTPRASSTTSVSTSYIQTVRTEPAFYRPIPADLAEKLGIEPKEG